MMKDVFSFFGSEQPQWSPGLAEAWRGSWNRIEKKSLDFECLPVGTSEFFYLIEDFLSAKACESLIAEFESRDVHPVGVDGYTRKMVAETIGSYRANAWAVSIARELEAGFRRILVDESELKREPMMPGTFRNRKGRRVRMPVPMHDYSLCGPTPFMRFMKYPGGGRHVPHYDAPFLNEKVQYVTLMSWVLYLNTPAGQGGEFQFVEDHQGGLHPSVRKHSDWTRMAKPEEVIETIQPRRGSLLIFPHWLPHQVAPYHDKAGGHRYIIRGDIAYGWD